MPRIVDSFIAELEREAATTRRVLERVPADKYDWKPHKKSYPLGTLAFHVANTPRNVAGILAKDTFEYGSLKDTGIGDPSELLATLDKSVATAKELLTGWDDAKAMATWKLVRGGEEIMAMPRIGLVRAIMLNHWYHHRGQLTVYLRLLDVPLPSVYGPTADENPFA
jgi:uncharacterized damage-inducible protein DinB